MLQYLCGAHEDAVRQQLSMRQLGRVLESGEASVFVGWLDVGGLRCDGLEPLQHEAVDVVDESFACVLVIQIRF